MTEEKIDRRYLYGRYDDEGLHYSLGDFFEGLDGDYEFGDLITVYQWSTQNPVAHLPNAGDFADTLLEQLAEWAADQGCVDEGWSDQFDALIAEDSVRKEASRRVHQLIKYLSRRMPYRMAAEVLARRAYCLNDDGHWDPVGPWEKQ